MTTLSIDFETRATVDLRATGVYPYSKHTDTDVWCMAWAFDDEEPQLWTPSDARPGRISEHIKKNGEVRAWNAQFERLIWQEIMVPRYGFMPVNLEQWVCSMAEGAAMALPRSLDGAASVLKVKQQKDKDGYGLMMRMTRPRSVKDGKVTWWDSDTDKLNRLYQYCMQDVRTERSIIKALRRLTPLEREVYLLDQRINDRGFRVDRELIEAAQLIATEGVERANLVITELTGGDVTAITQSGRLATWVREQGVETAGVAKKHVKELMEIETLDPAVREALQLRADAGRSSIAKLLTMLDQADVADDRVRGSMIYHAASTGRWGGKGVQPHNFPRGEIKLELLRSYIADVIAGRYDVLDLMGHPIVIVSSMLRMMIEAGPGKVLMAADFAAVEACVINWLAGQTDVTELFRAYIGGDKSRDPYKLMAVRMGRKPTLAEITALDRQAGKAAELGCGFGMGADKFVKAAWDVYQVRVNAGEAKIAVDSYRESHPRVKAFWYETENAALRAVQEPGVKQRFGVNDCLTAIKAGAYLYIVLPSGRPLCFAAPSAVMAPTPWGAEKLTLQYWGVDPVSKQWGLLRTYGGALVENIVQAVARDLLAEGMLRCEKAGYPVILNVHDEVVVEVPESFGSVKELETLLATPPAWANGCPIAAEGWRDSRYHK